MRSSEEQQQQQLKWRSLHHLHVKENFMIPVCSASA